MMTFACGSAGHEAYTTVATVTMLRATMVDLGKPRPGLPTTVLCEEALDGELPATADACTWKHIRVGKMLQGILKY